MKVSNIIHSDFGAITPSKTPRPAFTQYKVFSDREVALALIVLVLLALVFAAV